MHSILFYSIAAVDFFFFNLISFCSCSFSLGWATAFCLQLHKDNIYDLKFRCEAVPAQSNLSLKSCLLLQIEETDFSLRLLLTNYLCFQNLPHHPESKLIEMLGSECKILIRVIP